MDGLYADAFKKMLLYFESLANLIEEPIRVPDDIRYAYRFEDKSIQAAILQKLCRVITGLQAMQLLNQHGFLQEQAGLQRMHDEFTEDISFLALAVIFDKCTNSHEEYLTYFFEKEFDDPSSAIKSSQKRGMVSRAKIRAYINQPFQDLSTGIEASRTVSKAYSGYVHGSSPQIMELFFGNPPKFHLQGEQNSPHYQAHTDALLNNFYRGIVAFCIAAKSFGNDTLFREINEYSKLFANRSGKPEHLI